MTEVIDQAVKAYLALPVNERITAYTAMLRDRPAHPTTLAFTEALEKARAKILKTRRAYAKPGRVLNSLHLR